jgi:7-cyano-7-deazaguanine synthase
MTSSISPGIGDPTKPLGLLISGGLDSSILLGHVLSQGRPVQPFYIRKGLFWEGAELRALKKLLDYLSGQFPAGQIRPQVVFDMPLADVYGNHWSVTGREVPGGDTPDEAVYLPGRNALLLIKPAVWCRLHGIEELALAPLGSNPFPDAGAPFFEAFQKSLNLAVGGTLTISRPFAELHKRDVMELGRRFPLELTFSCIAPVGDLHCGRCNKCAERRGAFRMIDLPDPTRYADND